MIEKKEARLLGGTIFVATVRAYWKLLNYALRAHYLILLIHGFSTVNAQLLIAFGTAFYAMIPCLFTVKHPKIWIHRFSSNTLLEK